MLQDCVAAIRGFRRRPLLTSVVVACLALGIGSTVAVFSVANAVLLRRLPYPDADRLVLIRTQHAAPGFDVGGRVSETELREWQLARSFESIAGYRFMTMDLIHPERSERLSGLLVTPEFFAVFGLQAAAGRLLDDQRQASGLILGRGLWERRFRTEPAIIGMSVSIGVCCPQQPEIIRVPVSGALDKDLPFPPTLRGLRDEGHGVTDLVDYIAPVVRSNRRDQRELEAIAKLKPEASIAQAQADMTAIARSLEERFPGSNQDWSVRVIPLRDELFGSVRQQILLVMGASVLVLFIATAIAAMLMTFNGIARLHEIAVRTALGGTRRRLIRQFLTEGMLLTSSGSVVGILVAVSLRNVLSAQLPANLHRLEQTAIDARVLGFAVAVVVGCGLFVSIIPVLRILKFDVDSLLRADNGKSFTPHVRVRTYEPLLAVQIALTLALLIGSGLMVKSVMMLFAVPLGFDSDNVVTTTLSLPSAKHPWKYNAVFSERVVEHIRGIPGIEAAGLIRGLPMNESRFENRFQRWDRPEDAGGPLVRIRVVSGGYFKAIGIPIIAGRDFAPIDGTGEIGFTKVIIINEAMAQLLWPGMDAVGQRVTTGEPKQVIEVAGVVGNARYAAIDAGPIPEVYYPVGVFPQDQMALVVRTTGDPMLMTSALRTAITEVERDVFIEPFQTMDQMLANSVSSQRFLMLLLNMFTAVAVFLAVVGIAGIVAYTLSLRIREVGIRVAIGAAPRDVMLLVARQGLLPTVVGLAFGVLLAFGLTQQLSHMLYGVSPYDPIVFVAAVGGLSLVSVVAAGLSANRASRIDPAAILR